MAMGSGDMCAFGRAPMPAHYITHYRCDDYHDGTVTDARNGQIIQHAPYTAPRRIQPLRPEGEHTMTMHTGASHNRTARISTIAVREARTLKREPGVERVTRAGHAYRKGMNA